jgi:hypothetical protein
VAGAVRRRDQIGGRDRGDEGDELRDPRVQRTAEERGGPHQRGRDRTEARWTPGRGEGELADRAPGQHLGPAARDLERGPA